MSDQQLIDVREVCAELGIKLDVLRRMAERGEYPELLRVTRGVYRVRSDEHRSWMASRWTKAEQARAEITYWRMRETLS